MVKRIATELGRHTPFTAAGALSGIIIMSAIVFAGFLPQVSQVSYTVFYVLHPAHVVLSALVTTAMYKRYGKGKLWAAVLIGYTGSISIATLSDSIIPYLGETLLGFEKKAIHIGFVEQWQIVNPAALAGVTIGYLKPTTTFPHAGHVLLSTWASLFHVIMAIGGVVSWVTLLPVFLFLFLAVWIPCCLSDIVYPLLFLKGDKPHSTASRHHH